jgi:hypothetical protein
MQRFCRAHSEKRYMLWLFTYTQRLVPTFSKHFDGERWSRFSMDHLPLDEMFPIDIEHRYDFRAEDEREVRIWGNLRVFFLSAKRLALDAFAGLTVESHRLLGCEEADVNHSR